MEFGLFFCFFVERNFVSNCALFLFHQSFQPNLPFRNTPKRFFDSFCSGLEMRIIHFQADAVVFEICTQKKGSPNKNVNLSTDKKRTQNLVHIFFSIFKGDLWRMVMPPGNLPSSTCLNSTLEKNFSIYLKFPHFYLIHFLRRFVFQKPSVNEAKTPIFGTTVRLSVVWSTLSAQFAPS